VHLRHGGGALLVRRYPQQRTLTPTGALFRWLLPRLPVAELELALLRGGARRATLCSVGPGSPRTGGDPADPVPVLLDKTLERQRGRRIAYKGRFRDRGPAHGWGSRGP